MYANNPAYQLQKEIDGWRIYTPVNIMDDTSLYRYTEAINQDIYNRAGASKEVIEQVMNMIIERCNDTERTFRTARTDIAALANSMLFRLKNPVDEHCALRMGFILSYMENDTHSEPVTNTQPWWMNKKMELAMNNPEAYAFFLTWGMSSSPTYREALDTLTDSNYFNKRQEQINAILPYNSKLTTTTQT